MREVNEWLKLHNLCIDYVVIRSELKYLMVAKNVHLKCRVFGGKTGPFPMILVFGVVRPIATVRIQVEPEPELAYQFVPVANTNHSTMWPSWSIYILMTAFAH